MGRPFVARRLAYQAMLPIVQVLRATDEGGRDVGQLIVDGAEASPKEDGSFVKYCWDNPAVPDDNIDEADNDPAIAPGDSLKISYVVDPFSSLGVPAPSGSPGIIFGSGIYPEMPDPDLPECNGNGIAGDGGGHGRAYGKTHGRT